MISFCDIPLSLAKKQMGSYGSYAIGMTKEWGIANKLNPVVYIEKESLLGDDIQVSLDDTVTLFKIVHGMLTKSGDIIGILSSTKYYEKHKNSITELTEKVNSIKTFTDNNEKHKLINSITEEINSVKAFNEEINIHKITLNEYSDIIKQLGKILRDTADSKINFFRYVKNYQGTLIRNDKTCKNYRFYDEREWRYVPAISDKGVEAFLNESQFKKYRGTAKAKPLVDKITLHFTSEDIKYLIVKSSKEISMLIKLIKSTDNLSKNSNVADILTTKIMTIEQLNNDF